MDKIDKMDYELVSLDTIAKIPNTFRAGSKKNQLLESATEADRELLLKIMQDNLFESDQIQYVQR
jgi:hypothetical protein